MLWRPALGLGHRIAPQALGRRNDHGPHPGIGLADSLPQRRARGPRSESERFVQELAAVEVVELVIETQRISRRYLPYGVLPPRHQPFEPRLHHVIGATALTEEASNRVVLVHRDLAGRIACRRK